MVKILFSLQYYNHIQCSYSTIDIIMYKCVHEHVNTLLMYTSKMNSGTHLPFFEWLLCFEVAEGKSLDSVNEILGDWMNWKLKIEQMK